MNFRRITGKSKSEKESSYKRIDLETTYSSKTNKISTKSFTLITIIPKTMIGLVHSPAFLWFLFVVSIEFTPYVLETSIKVSVILPLAILFLKNFLKNCLLLRSQHLHDKVINEKLFAVYQDPGFVAVRSDEIVEGDIVLVKTNQRVPADALVLAVDNENNELFVRNCDFDENIDLERKKAVKETQVFITEDGMSVTDVKKHIESIKIVQPNSTTEKVESKIKVKNNPRVIHTTFSNFVLGGSELVDSEWILCLIVYVGFDTKKWINFQNVNPMIQSRLDRQLNICLLMNFILLILFILLTCFLGVYYKSLQFEDSSISLAFYSIAIYGNLVPVTLYLCTNIFKSVSSIILTASNYPHSPSIINTNIIDDLGKAEYIITERTGVLTDNQVKVQACLINNCLYKEEIQDSQEDQISESEANEQASITNKSLQEFENFSFEDLRNEIYSENCPVEKRLFAFCIALCNTYTNDTSLEATNEVDSAFIEFSKSLGMNLVSRAKNKVEVEFNSSNYKFSLNALGSMDNKEFNFKATLKDYSTNFVYLVYKVQSSIVEPSEMDEDYSILQDGLDSIQLKKYQKIMFLYKKLKNSEVKKISKEYQEALQYKVNRKQRISSVFDTYKTNMKFLGLVAYENSIDDKTVQCIESLTQSGIKIWISSSSSEESLVANAYYLKLIDEETSLVQIKNIKSVNEAIELVTLALKEQVIYKGEMQNMEDQKGDGQKTRRASKRNMMKQQERGSNFRAIFADMGVGLKISKQIKSAKDLDINFAVCLGSDLLNLALKSRELMKNLVMLLFTARTVLVYSVNNEQKKNIIKIVKENFSFKPVVIAVGQGQRCFKLLNEASVGIKIDQNSSHFIFSDVKIEEFSQLKEVILDLGRNGYQSIRIIYLLFMFKEGMVITLLFLFQYNCGFSGCSIISFDLLVVYELLISLSFILFSGFSVRTQLQSENLKVENFSLDHIIISMVCFFIVGAVQGTLILIFVVFGIGGIGDNGMAEDSDTLGLTAFIMINLVLFAHGFVIFKNIKKFFWVTLYCLCLLGTVLAIACNSNISINYLSNSSFSQKPIIWFLIFLYPFFGLITSYTLLTLISILIPRNLPRLVEYQDLEKVFCDSVQWLVVKEKNEFELDNKNLKFKDSYRESEYLQQMYNKSIFFLRLIFVLTLILEVINNIFIEVSLVGFLDLKIYTIIITCFSAIMVIVGFFLLNTKRFIFIEMTSLIGLLVFSIVETYVNTTIWTIPRYPIFAALYSLIISTGFYWTIFKYVLIYFLSIAALVYETYVIDHHGIAVHTSHWCIIMMFVLILLLLVNYQHEKNKRKQYTFIKQAEIEVDKSATILSFLLPEFVRKRVKDGARYISEDKGTVSIVFCDVYDFDSIMNLYSPQELTYLMNDMFGRIDLICENLGVTKIETVGKTYLACAGLKDSEINLDPLILKNSHARRAVELGLAILKESEKILLKNGQKIKFKIGINSGPVTAGVVGFHKPQFSLVGDTVNTASRMASTLKEADAVQISLNTYELLGSTHGLKFTDFVLEVKGKGNMETKVVSLIEQNTDDTNSEELSSIQGNLITSLKSCKSSPTFQSIQHRHSETSFSNKNQNRRSSILVNLGVNNTQELVNKQTTRNVQGVFNVLCKETEQEKKLRVTYIEEISKTQKIGLYTSVACDSLLILTEAIYYALNLEHSSLPRLLTVVVGVIAMMVLIYLKPKFGSRIVFAIALSALYTAEFISIFICEFFTERSSNIQYMYFVYKFTLLNFFSGTFFGKNLYFNIVISSFWLADTFYRNPSLPSVTYTISYIAIILYSAFSDEQRLRINTILKLAAEKEINKTQQLLTHMMPPNALANLEEGTQVMDRLAQVTVMYADIVGFTAWSSIRSPREVVGMLSELFTRFDKQCIENNVYKVHTIGDCYVAMGYVDDKNRNPAKEAVNMLYFAHSLIGIIAETNEKCGIQLGMRIGMHTGEITGGITGTKIVRYDIYGPHVMIANKMESSGQAGSVAVSESTKELIENFKPGLFSFTKFKEVSLDSLSKSINLYLADLNEAVSDN